MKNAQEAHEAIRPAGDCFRTPKELERELDRDELALYELIWKRTRRLADGGRARPDGLAAARRDARIDGRDAEFRRSGTVITFRGFLAAYEEGRDDDAAPEATRSGRCRS